MGALCSREDGLFFRQNMGITTVLFFNGGFLQNIGMKVMIYQEKSEGKNEMRKQCFSENGVILT